MPIHGGIAETASVSLQGPLDRRFDRAAVGERNETANERQRSGHANLEFRFLRYFPRLLQTMEDRVGRNRHLGVAQGTKYDLGALVLQLEDGACLRVLNPRNRRIRVLQFEVRMVFENVALPADPVRAMTCLSVRISLRKRPQSRRKHSEHRFSISKRHAPDK